MMRRLSVAVTTDGSGNATGYTEPVSGWVAAIAYVPHASTPLDTGADITITGNTSGIPIVTITDLGTVAVTVHPRAATKSTAAAAALYAAGGTAVNDRIPVADEAIKIVVASGAATKSGTFHVYVDE
jgi:hypothetical protein